MQLSITSQLRRDNLGQVYFPEYFQGLVEDNSITVLITPLSGESMGIAVVKKGKTGFRVKELLQGLGTYEYDWEVKAKRKGFKNYPLIQKISARVQLDEEASLNLETRDQ